MKENETKNERAGKSLDEAVADFTKAAWGARNKYRGLSLEEMVNMLFAPKSVDGEERELTGEELTQKLEEFRFAKRLNELTDIAFQDLNSPKAVEDLEGETKWDRFMFNGRHADDLWGAKYAHVKDPALKNQLYQLETLREVFDGKSEISVETVNSIETIVPEGPRNEIRSSVMKKIAAENPITAEEELEEEPAYDEPEVAAEEKDAKPPEDPLNEEAMNNFEEKGYERLWRSNPGAGIYASPASIITAIFDEKPLTSEIIPLYTAMGLNQKLGMPYQTFIEEVSRKKPNPQFSELIQKSGINVEETLKALNEKVTLQNHIQRFDTLGAKHNLDGAINEFFKEISSPERDAFLKEIGKNSLDTIKVNGQTLEERYGKKYASVTDPALKEKCYKVELMHEMIEQHMRGKKGKIPEITVDSYEMKDGEYVLADSKSVKIERRVVPTVDLDQVKKPEEPVPLSAEEMRENLINIEERIINEAAVRQPDEKTVQSVEAKWALVNQINDIHKQLQETLKNLNSVAKNSLQGNDTTLYTNMKNKLEKCIKLSDPENGLSSSGKLMEAMNEYQKSAQMYHGKRRGFLFRPGTDAGKIRLKESKNAIDTIPKQVEQLKKTIEEIGEPGSEKQNMADILESALETGRKYGMKSRAADQISDKFGIDYLEKAAKQYLKDNNMQINQESIADISLDNDFINVVNQHPVNFSQKYEHFLAAKDFLKDHYKKLAGDESLDANTRDYANDMLRSNNMYNNAMRLSENPDFVDTYEKSPSMYKGIWENKVKAQAYLTQKNGAKPTEKDVSSLASNKVFKVIAENNPSDYGAKWDENMKKAEELKAKYKEELDDMLGGLEDYEGGLVTYVKDDYKAREQKHPGYENALKNLNDRKKAINEERDRIYDEREALDEIEDPEQRKQKEEQIEKDADVLENNVKAYKKAKKDAVREHLLPEYVARIAFLKTTQDPKLGENVCRLMAVSPKQEKAAMESIVDNLSSPENRKLLNNNKELTAKVVDGSIMEQVVPGLKKPEPAKKQGAQMAPKQPKVEQGGMKR